MGTAKEYKGTKYPREVGAVVRKTKTLAVSASFAVAKAENGDTPLAIYDKDYSRIIVAALDKEAVGKKSASANIPVSELAEIFARTDYLFTKHMDELLLPSQGDSAPSLAYTFHFPAKSPLRGKTAAEVLLDDPANGVNILKQQYEYCKANLEKYPKNADAIAAITDAMTIFRAGKLEKKASRVVPIYSAEAHALIRKKREDGMCPVHNLEITWTLGKDSPVAVTVANYYAPVIIQQDGRINAQSSKMDKATLVSVTINCTSKEWLNLVRKMKAAMGQFEAVHAKECLEDADRAEKRNRSAAGFLSEPQIATPQMPPASCQPQEPVPPIYAPQEPAVSGYGYWGGAY